MALISQLRFSHPYHLSSLSSTQTSLSLPHYLPQFSQHHPTLENQTSLKIRATGGDMLGDFGARDPFPAEQDCTPVSPLHPPISRDDAQKLLKKVVGWRLLDEEGGLRLQCLWKLRDFKCGVDLINRIYRVVEVTGHFPNLHLELPNQVRAELWTASIGGLSMNDFIVAAKIDEIKTSDLVPKKRIWA
ncbi:hypothetical protein CsSME_00001257 [Camellia sinensis var. sinensis]